MFAATKAIHILVEAARLLDDQNFFIARRAYWHLEKQTADAQIMNRMRRFYERCSKDGRLLK